MISKKFFATWIALLIFATSAFAGTAKEKEEEEAPEEETISIKFKGKKDGSHGGAAGGFFVRAMNINVSNFSAAFTNNGFPAPAKLNVGWGGMGYIITSSNWYFGGG